MASNSNTIRRRGIYLLPNLFTTGAMFAGFYAITSAMNAHYETAVISIFVAMILDGLDGIYFSVLLPSNFIYSGRCLTILCFNWSLLLCDYLILI